MTSVKWDHSWGTPLGGVSLGILLYGALWCNYFSIRFHSLLDRLLEIRNRFTQLYLLFSMSLLHYGPSPSLTGLIQCLLEELPVSSLLSITASHSAM